MTLEPGPGAYNEINGLASSRAQTAKFGTEKRNFHSGTFSPGPGAYDGGSKKAGVGHKFGVRPQTAKVPDGPGPGAYDSSLKTLNAGAVSSRISKGSRMEGLNKTLVQNPGPGMYDSGTNYAISREKSPNIKFGTSKRQ